MFFVGISLRKVEKGQQREGEKGRMDALHDVASILARRVAMEISDSESGSDSGSGSDWDDETRYVFFFFFSELFNLIWIFFFFTNEVLDFIPTVLHVGAVNLHLRLNG